MAKKVKFLLKMADEAQVRSLEELREHFDLASVLGYYDDGRLTEWLTDRYYEDEAKKIEALDRNASDFKKRLCEILGAPYSETEADNVSVTDISDKNKRRERLKGFTADPDILAKADRVAFSQEELADLLDEGAKEIYLCAEAGGRFKIPGSKTGVTYIGVNNPKVDIPDGYAEKGITFQNVDLGIDDIIRQAKESTDPYVSAYLWRNAAELGNAEAQCALGMRYYNGEGVEKDYAEAVKWFRKAAEQGDDWAQVSLGASYRDGKGVEKDYAEAVKWYRKAAEQGHKGAQFSLGMRYYNGEGVEKDYAEAVKWYRKAAEQGDDWAQVSLGASYRDGKGVEKDYAEAVKWYRKAAEQGHKGAQFSLGMRYYNGEGVEKDYAEAVKWFRKAAEQGDATAQYNLGTSYRDGEGVEQNEEEAIKWLRKAADQGNEDARKALIKIAPMLCKLSDVIKHAIGSTELNGTITVEWDTGSIHIPVSNRHKVNTTILEKFGATDVRQETCLTPKYPLTPIIVAMTFGSNAKPKYVDEGAGIIHMRLPNITPELKEDLLKAFPDIKQK